MEPNVFDKVHEVDLKKTMEQSYIDYAMSVISARALPDVRDGLKPVQRRVLYSMIELNNGPDKPHRKCARIVGDTMGKYHPHGDSSIYGALVNMAQEWSTRYPLVDGHGNFGSVDGDGAAAMRYTEARLSKISMEMLADINKDTVNFVPNFDETEREPVVLPSRYPNLLVNGASGIAVGMATNIPPHNLREVIGAVTKMIDNRVEEDRETTLEEILEIVKGPDFPTGATILGHRSIEEAYRTGRSKIKVRAVTNIETMANGKSRIIVTELPYMVNKARLIEKIADLVKEKKIDGITYIGDESNREGMRINIELRRDVNANVILNQLLKHTQLQDTFGVIMLALVDSQPKVLNLQQMLDYYLKHQEDVVRRRTQYDLNKAEERAHILEGLLIALDHIDEVISIIRGSANVAEAKTQLMERFGLSDAQAQAIVDMRLRALTGLEREKIENEYKELQARINELKAILADEKKLLTVIKDEMTIIADKYGDDRRTAIGYDDDMSMEDLIPDEDTVIAMTHLGYIKRMDVDNFRAQNRGGKGIKGMQTIEEDYIEDLLMTTNHHYVMFFTNTGRVYRLKAYEIPEAGRTARGTAIVNLLQLQPEEKITAIIPMREYNEDKYLFMATKGGMVKKTPMCEYENVRKNGLQAIVLRENDELIEVKATDNQEDIFLITKNGMCIRFHETDVRVTGRVSMGVIGMRFDEEDEVIGMQMASQGESLLVVSENGMGKRTVISEFSAQNRGGKGVICYKITEKTGCLIGAKLVDDGREIMMITTEGIVIRMVVDDISVIGRNTSGVKLMAIDHDSDIKVASIAKVRESVTKDSNVYNEEYIEDENGETEDESGETEGDESGSEE
ncbi:MAG: DNA gyrase subunit A [Enterocloster asparagiformis]|nr:DNA gyrase subunit A [Enterocloster asparagiformis]